METEVKAPPTSTDPTSEGGEEIEAPEPVEPVSYPLTVIYCGNCGLPPEVRGLIY